MSPDEVRARTMKAPPTIDVREMLGPDARDAVVMVPLSFVEGELPRVHVVVRAQGLRDHAGEVSFPGGKVEAGEELARAVAREAEEEVGLTSSDFELLGELFAVPVVTGRYLIHPFVARVTRAPRITSSEHARLYEVPLARWLDDREPIEVTEAPWRGLPFMMPHFAIGEHVMYGASAIILFDLLSRLADRPLETVRVENKPWGDRYAADEKRIR
ncbi:MAG: CoA pyrophosphatase [Polyangiaceae bacterium]